MEGVSIKEIWMLLGEKDVQIYQLLKEIERLSVVDQVKKEEEKPVAKKSEARKL